MSKQQKGLQKLTKNDKSSDIQAFAQQLLSQHPELPEHATPTQKQARADAILKGFLGSPFMSEESKEDLRNQTWENNHDELTRVISKLIRDNGRMPTANMLSEETGLSRQTIHKHLKEFYQSSRYQNQLNQFRMLSDRVLANLYRLSTEGDVRAAKVFLDAVGGLPIAASNSNESANFIQVNNNIKIDQVTFATLPESVQQQITGLILQGLQTKQENHQP